MVAMISSPSPLSGRRRRRRRSFLSLRQSLNFFDTLVSSATTCSTSSSCSSSLARLITLKNVPHFIVRIVVFIGIVLYCMSVAATSSKPHDDAGRKVCFVSSSSSSSLSTTMENTKNRMLSSKIHLIQPYFDGNVEKTTRNDDDDNKARTIRQFELYAVREANKMLFRSACFPRTRLLKDILEFARPDVVNVIANADILFDETVEKLVDHVTEKDNVVFALTRHEADGYFSGRQDSQDVWIFYGKGLEGRLTEVSNISSWLKIGKPGFDNRLAYELYKAGYRVLNPSRSISVWHVHASEERSYTAQETVPPPYFAVEPMHLEDVVEGFSFSSSPSSKNKKKKKGDDVLVDRNTIIYGGPFEYVWDHRGQITMRYL